jgi:release factor glutamine methyltransferase
MPVWTIAAIITHRRNTLQGAREKLAPAKARTMHLPTVSAALAVSGLVPLEAKLLLAHVLGRDRAWLAAHGDAALEPAQACAFDALVRRRSAGEPVAYLTGRREFFGLDLEVTPDVLVPRAETELLVELALSWLAPDAAVRVLDLGCGSGAVALAIARERPRASVIGVDLSPAPVELALRNGQRLGIANAAFIESDWFARVPPEPFALIVANPPYVAEEDPHLSESDLRFEPRSALVSGRDGLDCLRVIVAAAPAHLASGARLALEHGYDQAEAVRALLSEAGFAAIASARDLAGIERVTYGRRP